MLSRVVLRLIDDDARTLLELCGFNKQFNQSLPSWASAKRRGSVWCGWSLHIRSTTRFKILSKLHGVAGLSAARLAVLKAELELLVPEFETEGTGVTRLDWPRRENIWWVRGTNLYVPIPPDIPSKSKFTSGSWQFDNQRFVTWKTIFTSGSEEISRTFAYYMK